MEAPTPSRTARYLKIALCIAAVTALRGLVGTAGMHRDQMQLKSQFDFGFEQGQLAANLAAGNGYSVRFGDSRPLPSAWASPLYPLLLAGIFRLWGTFSFESQIAVIWLNSFFHGIIAVTIFALARRLQNNFTALLAVLLFLFLPSGWQFLHWAWCTHLLAALITLHIWVLESAPRHRAAWAGLTLGLALLTDAVTITLLPITLWRLLRRTNNSTDFWPPRKTSRIATFLITTLLVLSPWTIRNGLVLRKWSPLRGMLGTALWMGNHPGAANENYLGLRENPWHNANAAARYAAQGEATFDDDNKQRFFNQLRDDPLTFAKSCAMRFSGFWFGQWWTNYANYPRVYSVGLVATTLLAAFGILKSLQRRRKVGVYIAVVLLYPLPYFATFLAYGRYRYPIEPLLCVLAAVGLSLQKNAREESRV